MLKFSPCIDMMFKEAPDFYHRFELAADAGAQYVEFWNWAGRDIPRIKSLCQRYKLKIACVCVNSDQPETASVFNAKKLLYRDGIDAFVAATVESIAVAKQLDIPSLIITVGQERNDATRYEQHTNIVLALKKAAPLLEESGVTMIVEPLNILTNHRGYFLSSSYEAFSICEEVGSPNVKLLYDIYHQQISEGNLIPTIRKYFPLIGHFHVADVPGRHEPGTGEINYVKVFAAINELGYDKYVGLEYSPTIGSAETFNSVIRMEKET